MRSRAGDRGTSRVRSDGSRTAERWEIPVGFVTVAEAGLLTHHDLYEYDDTDLMLARFSELTGG